VFFSLERAFQYYYLIFFVLHILSHPTADQF
jgi:hypothetical protein